MKVMVRSLFVPYAYVAQEDADTAAVSRWLSRSTAAGDPPPRRVANPRSASRGREQRPWRPPAWTKSAHALLALHVVI